MTLRKGIAFLLSMILILVSAMPVQALDAPVIVPTDERSKTQPSTNCSRILITGIRKIQISESSFRTGSVILMK